MMQMPEQTTEGTQARVTAVPVRKRSGTAKRQKQRVMTFRLTEEEYAALAANAQQAGLAIGSYIRSRTLKLPTTKPRRRPTADVRAVIRLQGELNRIGGNIHQLLKRINFGETPLVGELREAFAGYRDAIGEIRAALGWGGR